MEADLNKRQMVKQGSSSECKMDGELEPNSARMAWLMHQNFVEQPAVVCHILS